MARGSERSEQNTQKIQRHQHHDKQNTHGTHGYGQARADFEIASTPNTSVELEKHHVSENQFDLQDSNRMDTHSYASVSHTYDSEQDRLQVKTAVKVADEYNQLYQYLFALQDLEKNRLLMLPILSVDKKNTTESTYQLALQCLAIRDLRSNCYSMTCHLVCSFEVHVFLLAKVWISSLAMELPRLHDSPDLLHWTFLLARQNLTCYLT